TALIFRQGRHVANVLGNSLDDRIAREVIATAMREVADEVCRDHFNSISQEPHMTSRIGHALETFLRDYEFAGYAVEVVAQDFPDRGPRSLESLVGADLYVEMSKGLLAQSKLGPNLSRGERRSLKRQCRRMLNRTDSSYVWVYTETGVRVIRAQDVERR